MPLSHSYFLTSLFYPLSIFLYSPFSFLFLCSLFLPYFPFLFFLAIFLTCFSLLSLIASCCSSPSSFLLLVYCAQLRPFYISYRDEFYCFTPRLLLVWCGVLPRPPIDLLAAQPSSLPCAGRATFHSQTKEFFFLFSCSPWHSHPNKG